LKKPGPLSDPTTTYRPEALSRSLLRQLKEDRAAAKRNPGEIVGLDFDPILNAQNLADRYVVGAVRKVGSSYRVDVYAVLSGRKNRQPDVVPELVRQAGKWTFVNFHYGSGKDRSDLLSILKELRQERLKQRQ
jgi:hypothetical protein